MGANHAVLQRAGITRQSSYVEGESRTNAPDGGDEGAGARTVMVATDGSMRSLRILPHAEAFASRSGASVRLVHILPPDGPVALDGIGQEGQRETVVYSRGRSESLAEAIARVASELQADLIAMHTEHSFSGMRHAAKGSVTLDVLDQTHIPLLVSGPSIGEAAHGSRRFVVATDGSPPSDWALLRQAGWLLERSFEVTLLEVYMPRLGDEAEREEIQSAEARLDQLKQRLIGESSFAVESAPDPRQVESRVVEKALELEALGIAMSTEAHRRMRHLVLGSVSMAILRKSPLPLLLASR